MIALLSFLVTLFASPLKGRLEAENAVLRHQLTVLQRRLLGRARSAAATSIDLGRSGIGRS